MTDCKDSQKLPRVPNGTRIEKRPLLRPPIASPFSGRQNEKVIYISSKTPFVSALKRAERLLRQIDNRAIQAEKNKLDPRRGMKEKLSAKKTAPESVVIRATGKAIDKTLQIALAFQNKTDCKVEIRTGSIGAIDDITSRFDKDEEGHGVPESRLRTTSLVEVFITPDAEDARSG